MCEQAEVADHEAMPCFDWRLGATFLGLLVNNGLLAENRGTWTCEQQKYDTCTIKPEKLSYAHVAAARSCSNHGWIANGGEHLRSISAELWRRESRMPAGRLYAAMGNRESNGTGELTRDV